MLFLKTAKLRRFHSQRRAAQGLCAFHSCPTTALQPPSKYPPSGLFCPPSLSWAAAL